MTFNITNVHGWEVGLFKGAKYLLGVGAVAILTTAGNWLASYTPTNAIEASEIVLGSAILGGLVHWIQAHMQANQAATPAAPVDNPTPPAT